MSTVGRVGGDLPISTMGRTNAVVKLLSSCALEPSRSNNYDDEHYRQDRRRYPGCSKDIKKSTNYFQVQTAVCFEGIYLSQFVLLCSAQLLKPWKHHYVGMAMATHQCWLKAMFRQDTLVSTSDEGNLNPLVAMSDWRRKWSVTTWPFCLMPG